MRVRFCIYLLVTFGLSTWLACGGGDDTPTPIDPVVEQGCVITEMTMRVDVNAGSGSRFVFNYDGPNPYEILHYDTSRPETIVQRIALTYDDNLLSEVRVYDGNNELWEEANYQYQNAQLQTFTREFRDGVSVINRFVYDGTPKLTQWQEEVTEGGTVTGGIDLGFTYNNAGGLLAAIVENNQWDFKMDFESAQLVNPLKGNPLMTLFSTGLWDFEDFFVSGELFSNKETRVNGEVGKEFSYEYEVNDHGYPTSISRQVIIGADVNIDRNLYITFQYACAN